LTTTGEIRFNQPRLLLVEGVEDRFFFTRLIQERGLPNFKIFHSGLKDSRQGGNSLFGRALSTLKLIPSFAAIRHVVIVTDADDSAANAFAFVQQTLSGKGHAPPAQPCERTTGNPTIEIVVVPLNEVRGNLESVCLQPAAAAARADLPPHVDTFEAVTRANQWPAEKRAKMWLRAYLAAACERDPFVPLGDVFADRRYRTLMDFNHASLTPLANILESYR
jgi:hypothetical protein